VVGVDPKVCKLSEGCRVQAGHAKLFDLFLLCREKEFSDAKLQEQMQPTLDEIKALLDGIEVEAVRLLGEPQFSRHSMRVYDRCQFDDVSYAADAKAEKKGRAGSGHDYRMDLGRTKP
jgi:hypothetical protein